MGTARRLSRESGQTAHVNSEGRYAAGTWPERPRVIIKAEVVRHPGRAPKDNPRFVVTNLAHSPGIFIKRSTAPVATSKIESKSCITTWRSTAPVALASSPISCAAF